MSVDASDNVVLFLYEPDQRCELEPALAYAELITDKKVERVLVYEGDYRAFDMQRRYGNRQGAWVNIAREGTDAL